MQCKKKLNSTIVGLGCALLCTVCGFFFGSPYPLVPIILAILILVALAVAVRNFSLQKLREAFVSTNEHCVSNFLCAGGAVLMFLGFVFPGWFWLFNTPGDVENFTIAGAGLVGIFGVVLFVIAIATRLLEKCQR